MSIFNDEISLKGDGLSSYEWDKYSTVYAKNYFVDFYRFGIESVLPKKLFLKLNGYYRGLEAGHCNLQLSLDRMNPSS